MRLGKACLAFGDPFLVPASGGKFAFQKRDLDAEVIDVSTAVFHRWRDRVLADRHASASGVEEADRLVGQLPSGDEPMRELDGTFDRLVKDADAVVLFKNRGDSSHHADGAVLGRLLDLDDLEPPGECCVLLEVFLVFGPGGRGDRSEFASR